MCTEKFCAYCGRPFSEPGKLPQPCECGNFTYRNPIPVICTLIPVIDGEKLGLLTIKRGIEPCYGLYAFPGGYMELNETWTEGAAREVWEETGIHLPPETLTLFHLTTGRRRDRILLYALSLPLKKEELPETIENDEVLGYRIITEPEELAFIPHTYCARKFFEKYR